MPANHSNTNRVITILIHSDKMHFQNVCVILLLRGVTKDATSLLLSWHLNAMILMPKIFDVIANENVCYKRNEVELFQHIKNFEKIYR